MRGLVPLERLSFGDKSSPNILIQGDNALTLGILARQYSGAVKCVYLDPPYNNGERYTHYPDSVHHDAWLSWMTRRLELLQPLLSADGSIWISIDDNEVHYLKVVADAIFGRERFVATIVWQHRTTRENRRAFSNNHEYLLVYANDPSRFRHTRNRVHSASLVHRYGNPDSDPRGPWQSVSANVQAGHATPAQFYTIRGPSGRLHAPPKGRCWVYSEDRMRKATANGEVWFGRDGNGVPRLKRFLSAAKLELTPETLWTAEVAGTTREAAKHLLQLFPNEQVFETPKPEPLIKRILDISSDPGDLVLDPFLGSSTTAAVAHKLGRRYIGIESGGQAVTHCAQRLRKVVQGEPGGISQDVGWSGGGGFRFFRLANNKALAA